MAEGDQSSRSIGLCSTPTQPTPEIPHSNELRPAISHAGAVTPGMEPPIGASATTQARRDQLATRMFPGPVRTLCCQRPGSCPTASLSSRRFPGWLSVLTRSTEVTVEWRRRHTHGALATCKSRSPCAPLGGQVYGVQAAHDEASFYQQQDFSSHPHPTRTIPD
ncbi:hypothetical protein BDP81DRAFT_439369 [Colletotrichum phormii]|uniref:Uncharacterized protein n=1 Tax=Colletotrichum phormii TaxID=359342 RepID=A0AAJ0E8Y3_9PEZI|nr:uncharacterized protein BDP81DRAFT_439369 [Colletotrichum phormii]KAK1623354.1 hypothetical protein BDP81DRAFT_439369 [Colletotrichum phormii]